MLVTLTQDDLPRLKTLIDASPLETMFLGSRVERFGLGVTRLGCPVLGVVRGGKLVTAVHFGANLMGVGDPDCLGEVIEHMGRRVHTQSILGSAVMVDRLYTGLVQRWGTSWAQARDMRAHQPLLAWWPNQPPLVAPDRHVHAIGLNELAAYYQAAVSMYTEEVGVTPLDATNSYHSYVHYLVTTGKAFGAGDGLRMWFKTDLGATYQTICQVQGVWLDPSLRGHGYAEPLMAGVLELLRPAWSCVSLYVNDYNVRARRMYDRLGFTQVGELATVLY